MAYTVPTAADLKALYPEFASVADATVDAWIARVNGRDVDTSWREADFAWAIEAAAAHRMALGGILGAAMGQAAGFAAAGVTGFKSGTVDITLDASTVARIAAGGWNSTRYGRDYLDLLRANKQGLGVTHVGHFCPVQC